MGVFDEEDFSERIENYYGAPPPLLAEFNVEKSQIATLGKPLVSSGRSSKLKRRHSSSALLDIRNRSLRTLKRAAMKLTDSASYGKSGLRQILLAIALRIVFLKKVMHLKAKKNIEPTQNIENLDSFEIGSSISMSSYVDHPEDQSEQFLRHKDSIDKIYDEILRNKYEIAELFSDEEDEDYDDDDDESELSISSWAGEPVL